MVNSHRMYTLKYQEKKAVVCQEYLVESHSSRISIINAGLDLASIWKHEMNQIQRNFKAPPPRTLALFGQCTC